MNFTIKNNEFNASNGVTGSGRAAFLYVSAANADYTTNGLVTFAENCGTGSPVTSGATHEYGIIINTPSKTGGRSMVFNMSNNMLYHGAAFTTAGIRVNSSGSQPVAMLNFGGSVMSNFSTSFVGTVTKFIKSDFFIYPS